MALNSLLCADVPLRNYGTHSPQVTLYANSGADTMGHGGARAPPLLRMAGHVGAP